MMELTSEAVFNLLLSRTSASTRGVGDADPDVPVEDFEEGGSDVLDGEVEKDVLLVTGFEVFQPLSPTETVVDKYPLVELEAWRRSTEYAATSVGEML